VPGETGAELDAAVMGVRRAAQRKLDHELGIKTAQVPIDDFHFLTRIHYKAPSDGKWGEHESEKGSFGPASRVSSKTNANTVDYILFIQANVDLDVNPNEVRDYKYVTEEELKQQFADPTLKFTPWFKLICTSMLFSWWDSMKQGKLGDFTNEKQIRRML